MTECTQDSFEFEAHFSRQVTAKFDAGTLTTDGGGLLLRQTERRIGLLKRLAGCFTDCRRADRVEHRLDEGGATPQGEAAPDGLTLGGVKQFARGRVDPVGCDDEVG